jgi:hypothetical protein
MHHDLTPPCNQDTLQRIPDLSCWMFQINHKNSLENVDYFKKKDPHISERVFLIFIFFISYLKIPALLQ